MIMVIRVPVLKDFKYDQHAGGVYSVRNLVKVLLS